MRPQDVRPFLQLGRAQLHQHDGLAMGSGVDAAACLQRLPGRNGLFQGEIPGRLCCSYRSRTAFPLSLVRCDEGLVSFRKLIQSLDIRLGVSLPCRSLVPCSGSFLPFLGAMPCILAPFYIKA